MKPVDSARQDPAADLRQHAASDDEARARQDWRSVWHRYRAQIESGELPPGHHLPTLAELAASNGLTVHAARQVMSRLRAAGLVVSWQGVGHRVAQPAIDYDIVQRTRFAANIDRSGHRASTEVIGRRHIRANALLARDMGVRQGTAVLLVELLRKIDGRPTMLGLHHFVAERFDRIADILEATGSVSHALADCGVGDFFRRETLISSRLPTGHEALALRIPKTQPVVVATGINIQPDGAVVEVSCSVSRADCIRFRV